MGKVCNMSKLSLCKMTVFCFCDYDDYDELPFYAQTQEAKAGCVGALGNPEVKSKHTQKFAFASENS